MRSQSWTARETAVVIKEYPYCDDPRKLAIKLGRSYKALRSRAKVLRLYRKVRNSNFGRTIVRKEDDAFLKENYQLVPAALMGRWLGYSETCIKTRYRQLGLKMSRRIIKTFVEMSRIPKGNIPMNKGKKQSEYMDPETIKRTAKTRFKHGQKPHNTLYDGAITIHHNHKERGSPPYKWIRLANAKWEMLHVFKWKKKHGAVPAGHIIVFKNGNTMDVRLSNLQCITRQQHAANTRETDGYIAMTLSHKRGEGKGKIDYELHQTLLKQKDLLDLKRQSLKLKRAINDKRRADTADH